MPPTADLAGELALLDDPGFAPALGCKPVLVGCASAWHPLASAEAEAPCSSMAGGAVGA